MPAPIIHNEMAATRTNRGGLDFVLWTTAPSHSKDRTDVYIFKNRV